MKDMIYILIEDESDLMFFEKIIEPMLINKYHQILYYKYARKKKMKFKNFIEVIHELDADYFLIGDKDNEETIEIAIETILNRTDNIAHKENVIVVIKEIESWYLAGLSEYLTSKFNITINLSNTEVFSKEDFYDIRPANLSIFWFMSIILEKYDLIKAFGRNNSLNNYHSIISSISD